MIADEMHERLDELSPSVLEVIDESEQHRGHAGWREGGQTHFRIRIKASALEPLTRIERHRLIHRRLGDIVPRIHALAIDILP